MEPFRYHVFVCDQQKPEGVPCCSERGSVKVIDALRREIARRGLLDSVQVTTCGSLGLCESGPNMVVYPEGIWYSGVRPEDVPELVQTHFGQGQVMERLARTDTAGLRAEIVLNRQRMMTAMQAKDASGVVPDELQQQIRGYQESRVILTGVELDVFTGIGSGASASEVALKTQCNARSMEMLLNALVALNLLEKRDGIYFNTTVSGRYLVAGGRDDYTAHLRHTINLWDRWSTLTEAVRAGTAVAGGEISARNERWTEAFIAAMDRNARERAPNVVRIVGGAGVRRMLDLGGGSGAYSIAFAGEFPELHSEILDLADVVPIAERHIRDAGLGGRITTRVGDLRTASLGSGFDLVFVSAICHMLGVSENEDLIRRIYSALRPGGRIVVQDFILNPDKTSPRWGVLFSLNMLVGTALGSSYSLDEFRGWLTEAGFQDVHHIKSPGPAGIMIGTRP